MLYWFTAPTVQHHHQQKPFGSFFKPPSSSIDVCYLKNRSILLLPQGGPRFNTLYYTGMCVILMKTVRFLIGLLPSPDVFVS